MTARIYQRPKNAMQSGKALTDQWILEFAPAEARRADPLMGWSGSGDTQVQVVLQFASSADAQAYAATMALPPECSERRQGGSSYRPTPTTSAKVSLFVTTPARWLSEKL